MPIVQTGVARAGSAMGEVIRFPAAEPRRTAGDAARRERAKALAKERPRSETYGLGPPVPPRETDAQALAALEERRIRFGDDGRDGQPAPDGGGGCAA